MSGINETNPLVWPEVEKLPNCMVAMPFPDTRNWLKKCRHLKGVIYPTTRMDNFGMVTAFGHLRHVWIGHGESEKGVNGPRTASLYDSVFMAHYDAAGRFPQSIRRWVRSGACAIGTPVVAGAVKDPWSKPRTVRTIIYAPTWEGRRAGADYSSLPEVAPILRDLLPALRERGVTVIVRAHPGSGRRQPEYREIAKDLVAAGFRQKGPKAEDFAEADLIISDVSGVTAEFLFTEKPVIMPVTANSRARGKDGPTLEREYPWAYRWDVGSEDLLAVLDALATDDPLRGRRESAARNMYRGHRTVEEAVRTFDTALSCVQWRGSRLPVWLVFEAKMRLAALRSIRRRLRPARGPVKPA
jgi:hypothetical protein